MNTDSSKPAPAPSPAQYVSVSACRNGWLVSDERLGNNDCRAPFVYTDPQAVACSVFGLLVRGIPNGVLPPPKETARAYNDGYEEAKAAFRVRLDACQETARRLRKELDESNRVRSDLCARLHRAEETIKSQGIALDGLDHVAKIRLDRTRVLESEIVARNEKLTCPEADEPDTIIISYRPVFGPDGSCPEGVRVGDVWTSPSGAVRTVTKVEAQLICYTLEEIDFKGTVRRSEPGSSSLEFFFRMVGPHAVLTRSVPRTSNQHEK